MDDNLDHIRIEWLQRLERREVAIEEAQGVLPGMKARLELLRDLHSSIKDHQATRDVEQEIQHQADEIRVVEEYIERADAK